MDWVWGRFAQNKVLAFKPSILTSLCLHCPPSLYRPMKKRHPTSCKSNYKEEERDLNKNCHMCIQWTTVYVHPDQTKHYYFISVVKNPQCTHYLYAAKENCSFVERWSFLEPCLMHQERTLCCKTSFLVAVSFESPPFMTLAESSSKPRLLLLCPSSRQTWVVTGFVQPHFQSSPA